MGKDPVALMCAEMGLPPPKALMRQARTTVVSAPAQRPAWPPGFVSQLGAMLEADGRKTAGGSAAERSRKATEARQAAVTTGAGWGSGTALNTPATQAVLAAAKPKLPMKIRPARPADVYEWRGHSAGYRAWCYLNDRGPTYERVLVRDLQLEGSKLLTLFAKPIAARVLVHERGVDGQRRWAVGKVKTKPPVSRSTRLGGAERSEA